LIRKNFSENLLSRGLVACDSETVLRFFGSFYSHSILARSSDQIHGGDAYGECHMSRYCLFVWIFAENLTSIMGLIDFLRSFYLLPLSDLFATLNLKWDLRRASWFLTVRQIIDS